MQWEEILYNICDMCVTYQKQLYALLAFILFMGFYIQDKKELVKVEYSISPKKYKKHMIRKYYVNTLTGKTYIVEKHTNKNIVNKSNWG